MHVRVELYSDLKKYAHSHDGPMSCAHPEGSSVDDLLAHLGIPAREEIIVGINGVLGSRQAALSDGDEVTLLTPMEGGAPSRFEVRDLRIG